MTNEEQHLCMSDLYNKVKHDPSEIARIDAYINMNGNIYTIHLWNLAKGVIEPTGKTLKEVEIA